MVAIIHQNEGQTEIMSISIVMEIIVTVKSQPWNFDKVGIFVLEKKYFL